MINRLDKIYNTLIDEKGNDRKIEDINKEIYAIQQETQAKIKKLEDVASSLNINITIDEAYNISLMVAEKSGIYIKPAYEKFCERWTVERENKYLIWCAVRDSLPSWVWYSDIKKGKFTTREKIYSFEGLEPIKEYINGKIDYTLTEEFKTIFKKIDRIYKYFGNNPRYNIE